METTSIRGADCSGLRPRATPATGGVSNLPSGLGGREGAEALPQGCEPPPRLSGLTGIATRVCCEPSPCHEDVTSRSRPRS